MFRSPVYLCGKACPSPFTPGRQLKWVEAVWGRHSVGDTDPRIMFSPLSTPWGVGLFACFSPSTPVLSLVGTELGRVCSSRALLTLRVCQHHRQFTSLSLAECEDCGSRRLVLAHCQHARSLLIMEHALILEAEIFFPSSKTVATGGLTIFPPKTQNWMFL